jgi:hypothetical protein
MNRVEFAPSARGGTAVTMEYDLTPPSGDRD